MQTTLKLAQNAAPQSFGRIGKYWWVMTQPMKCLQVLSARDAALFSMHVITIGGVSASLKMMMKKYHFRKGEKDVT
jgi:hypothetical protein